MHLQIHNYRGISHGAISLHPKITLIAGTNGSGKSSIAQALGCLLTGSTLPVIGVLKKSAHTFLHNGAETGSATLNGYTITWPDCKLSGISTHISSQYAAGRCPPVDMEPAEWCQYLDAHPTREDVNNDELWERLERHQFNWDAVRDQYNAEGQQLKGRWRQLTGQNYGSEQSPKWRPANLDATGKTEQDLRDGLAEAERLYEQAIKQAAVTEHETAELKKLAADRANAIAALTTKQTAMNIAKAEWKDAEELTKSFETPQNAAITYECPKCNILLSLSNDALHVHDGKRPSRKQVRDALAKLDDHVGKVKQLYADYEARLQDYRDAMAYADSCTRAAKTLEAGITHDSPYIDPVPAKRLVTVLTEALTAHTVYEQAKQLLRDIQRNATIQQILSPDGLRKQVLTRKLAEFNRKLLDASTVAEWLPVSITDDLNIRYGDREYRLLSLSEQYRVNAILQVTLANIDNSAVLVLDAADILDASGRNGLISLLLSAGKPAVVMMTFTSHDQAPDLAELGIGITYWVESSTVRELKTEAVA